MTVSMKKQLIKIVAFIGILTCGISAFYRVFNYKTVFGTTGLTALYSKDKDSIDVLCVGTSHLIEGINTNTLWSQYGIASFDLGAGSQPMPTAYYSLKEALKYQDPKLVIVDTYICTKDDNAAGFVEQVNGSFGFKITPDYYENVKITASEESQKSFFLKYPILHKRYNDLTEADFNVYGDVAGGEYWNGFVMMDGVVSTDAPDMSAIDTNMDGIVITPKNEEYLRKIIELCHEKDIPLLLTVVPYYTFSENETAFRLIQEIVDEYQGYDVTFQDYNWQYDEIGIDFSSDYVDSSHFNYHGSERFSTYLGQYLVDNYNLPDRRGDSAYEDYEKCNEYYEREKKLKDIQYAASPEEILNLTAGDDNYVLAVTASNGIISDPSYEGFINALSSYGINAYEVANTFDAWVIADGSCQVSTAQLDSDYSWHKEYKGNEVLTLTSAPYTDSEGNTYGTRPVIKVGDTELSNTDSMVSIYVYDKMLEKSNIE